MAARKSIKDSLKDGLASAKTAVRDADNAAKAEAADFMDTLAEAATEVASEQRQELAKQEFKTQYFYELTPPIGAGEWRPVVTVFVVNNEYEMQRLAARGGALLPAPATAENEVA